MNTHNTNNKEKTLEEIIKEKTHYKYCWLNKQDGRFSGSWKEEDTKLIDKEILDIATKDNWRLIKFQCINDDDFEFNHLMQLR